MPGNPYLDAAGRVWADNPQRVGQLDGVAAHLALHPHSRCQSVFAVDNLAFHGLFSPAFLPVLQLPASSVSGDGLEFHGEGSMSKAGWVGDTVFDAPTAPALEKFASRAQAPQRSAAVCSGASHSMSQSASTAVTVIEQPAISSEVTYDPVRWRTTFSPAAFRIFVAAHTIT